MYYRPSAPRIDWILVSLNLDS